MIIQTLKSSRKENIGTLKSQMIVLENVIALEKEKRITTINLPEFRTSKNQLHFEDDDKQKRRNHSLGSNGSKRFKKKELNPLIEF
jgi:hypothetical protein